MSKKAIVIRLLLFVLVMVVGTVWVYVIRTFPYGIPIEIKYERKFVYKNPSNRGEMLILWSHCTAQGGKFSTCGSPCDWDLLKRLSGMTEDNDVYGCVGVCATTCDL